MQRSHSAYGPTIHDTTQPVPPASIHAFPQEQAPPYQGAYAAVPPAPPTPRATPPFIPTSVPRGGYRTSAPTTTYVPPPTTIPMTGPPPQQYGQQQQPHQGQGWGGEAGEAGTQDVEHAGTKKGLHMHANLQHSPINKDMERHSQEGSKDMEAGGATARKHTGEALQQLEHVLLVWN